MFVMRPSLLVLFLVQLRDRESANGAMGRRIDPPW